MGKCAICNQEGDITAVVYVGYPDYDKEKEHAVYHYIRRTETFCRDCVKKQENSISKKGVFFYLILQLCWFNVYKNGLLDLVGLLSALIALVSLLRLLMMIGRGLLQKLVPQKEFPRLFAGETDIELEAGDLLYSRIQKEEEAYGHKIMSLREYRRKFRENKMPGELSGEEVSAGLTDSQDDEGQ